ncbi:MAG: cold shock domain-containing protein [Rhodanobacter sp.]
MRTHGTLSKWNDEKGYGFVALPSSDREVFVHISAFPHDGVRPSVGEVVSFEVKDGADGKPVAVQVMRPGARKVAPTRAVDRRSGHNARGRSGSRLASLLSLLAIGAMAVYAYRAYVPRHAAVAEVLRVQSPPTRRALPIIPSSRCDGRTRCSQMTSCAEATFFVKNCPNTQMDGDGDGQPCEQQWCN